MLGLKARRIKNLENQLEDMIKDRDKWKELAECRRSLVLSGQTLGDWTKDRCNAEALWHHGQIEHDVRERTAKLNDTLQIALVEGSMWKGKAEALELALKMLAPKDCCDK